MCAILGCLAVHLTWKVGRSAGQDHGDRLLISVAFFLLWYSRWHSGRESVLMSGFMEYDVRVRGVCSHPTSCQVHLPSSQTNVLVAHRVSSIWKSPTLSPHHIEFCIRSTLAQACVMLTEIILRRSCATSHIQLSHE